MIFSAKHSERKIKKFLLFLMNFIKERIEIFLNFISRRISQKSGTLGRLASGF